MNIHYGFTLPAQVIVCLSSLALGGCQRRPDLVDALGTAIDNLPSDYRGDPRELAPIIVVASVDENQAIAKHVEAARYQGVFLDLHMVRCKLENSLKGGLTGPELRFYYFADGKYPRSKPNPHYQRLFQAKPGIAIFVLPDPRPWRTEIGRRRRRRLLGSSRDRRPR